MKPQQNPRYLKRLILSALVVILFLVWSFAADRVNAEPVNPVDDTVQPDTRCAGGLFGPGGCPFGYEYVPPSQFAYSLLLDSFEYTAIPVNRPHLTPPDGDKWRNNETDKGGDSIPTEPLVTVTEDKLYGDRSLKIVALGESAADKMFQTFLYNNVGSSANNNWQYLRDLLASSWVNGKVNRMRIWIKLPVGMQMSTSGVHGTNFHVGTYIRHSGDSTIENESSTPDAPLGAHYYHYYNLQYEGDVWHQLIVDPHPSALRGVSGSVERTTLYEPAPTEDPGKTYFDLMTWFYIDHVTKNLPWPATYYVDGIELYEEPNDEDVEHIYSLYGTYSTVDEQVVVGWKRNKNLSDRTVSVKYAFSSFHENGGYASHGANVTECQDVMPHNPAFAPNGANGQECRAAIPNLAGKDFVYIALKHQDEATRFREIRIPLTASGFPVIGGSN